MDPNGALYDCQKNRRLTDGDLPGDLTAEDVIGFCNHHDVHFHACGTPAGVGGTGWDDPTVFRAGTNEVPSRGITILWTKIDEWKEAQRPSPPAASDRGGTRRPQSVTTRISNPD